MLPTFSDQWDAPFRSCPFSLRFELGGEIFGTDVPVPRFVQAFTRARQITQEVFESSQRLIAIVAWPYVGRDFDAPDGDGFEALREVGFACSSIAEWDAPLRPEEEDEEDRAPTLWRAFDLSEDQAAGDVLLWCAISYELAVTPKAPILSYFVDFERGILLHVYDDRGMDVTALDRDQLLTVYHARDEWLLDYDRARMATAFGAQP